MPLDPEKLDNLIGKLNSMAHRLEHLEMKARGDAVGATQRGVNVSADAAGGYAPIEPHQGRFSPETRADAEAHVTIPGGAGYNQGRKFKPGTMVRLNQLGSKPEKVWKTNGNMVTTESGREYHATKLVPA